MSHARATRVAWGMWTITLALSVSHLVLNASTDPSLADPMSLANVLAWVGALIAFQSFATVGAVLASRRPENPIGWLFCLSGLLCQLSNAGGAYVEFAYDHSLRGDVLASILVSPAWGVGAVLGVFAPLFLFPDGRPLTRRWRVVVWGIWLWVGAFCLAAFVAPGKLELHPTRTNPIGIDALSGLDGALLILLIAMLFLAIVAIALRFRRAEGVERQQLRVFVVTAITAVISIFVLAMDGVFVVGRYLGPFDDVVLLFLIALIPISMGVAILRYRLYDFDRVVSRTLAYALLTLILGAGYVGLVLAGQALFSSFAGGSNLAIAASTLVVAALFLPVRSRVQGLVDRRFYRSRYDAQRTLEAFGARLREQVDLDALHIELSGVVQQTMQPQHLSLWVLGRSRP